MGTEILTREDQLWATLLALQPDLGNGYCDRGWIGLGGDSGPTTNTVIALSLSGLPVSKNANESQAPWHLITFFTASWLTHSPRLNMPTVSAGGTTFT